jgi:hypothetical protein
MRQAWSRPYSAVAFHHIVGESVTRERRLRVRGVDRIRAYLSKCVKELLRVIELPAGIPAGSGRENRS